MRNQVLEPRLWFEFPKVEIHPMKVSEGCRCGDGKVAFVKPFLFTFAYNARRQTLGNLCEPYLPHPKVETIILPTKGFCEDSLDTIHQILILTNSLSLLFGVKLLYQLQEYLINSKYVLGYSWMTKKQYSPLRPVALKVGIGQDPLEDSSKQSTCPLPRVLPLVGLGLGFLRSSPVILIPLVGGTHSDNCGPRKGKTIKKSSPLNE